ncbi:MAG TPA: hypothetical protein VLU91_07715 [Nitrososphaerales archaeon]|nr:hypothetical protein [Nitrososphaerales archaeon]
MNESKAKQCREKALRTPRRGQEPNILDQICPECHVGIMLYDAPTKRYGCKNCGAFLTRDQLSDARFKAKTPEDDERRKRSRQQADYLEWWLSGNKEK